MAEEDWEGTGLLVANLGIDQPPSERRDLFPGNTERFAARAGHGLLTTSQLYEALRRDQAGELDRSSFYRAIIDGAGVIALREPTCNTDEQ